MEGGFPKVFISYSHDTEEHQERVLALADRLRADGIDAEVDQYNESPREGWPLWCERQIAAADFVLIVCTETYRRRVMGEEQPGAGLGVVWEAAIIRHLLYGSGLVSEKFVPVLFSDSASEHIPTMIRGWTRYGPRNARRIREAIPAVDRATSHCPPATRCNSPSSGAAQGVVESGSAGGSSTGSVPVTIYRNVIRRRPGQQSKQRYLRKFH